MHRIRGKGTSVVDVRAVFPYHRRAEWDTLQQGEVGNGDRRDISQVVQVKAGVECRLEFDQSIVKRIILETANGGIELGTRGDTLPG
jgi:hypothetical protein